jgi:hypothetical protein
MSKCPAFMRFSVTLLVLPPEACGATFGAASESDQCRLTTTPALRDATRFSSPYCRSSQGNHQNTIVPGTVCIMRRLRNHFHRKQRSANRLQSPLTYRASPQPSRAADKTPPASIHSPQTPQPKMRSPRGCAASAPRPRH